MPVATYLEKKQKNIQSKYHQVSKRFELKYESIHRKLTSRFHRESIETEFIHSIANNLKINSEESIIGKFDYRRFIPVSFRASTRQDGSFYYDIYDWIQGRFSGQVIRIVVREGKIIEKIFLTPKGNRISVRMGNLPLRFRSLPILKISIRLRFKPIEKIQLNLRSFSLK